MRAFICVGAAIIGTFILIIAGIETGVLDCNGQPCGPATHHKGSSDGQ